MELVISDRIRVDAFILVGYFHGTGRVDRVRPTQPATERTSVPIRSDPFSTPIPPMIARRDENPRKSRGIQIDERID